MRKLILRNHLSLGDIVMLTAAVRDLHRCYPNQFLTDVRTTNAELWQHNPNLTALDENDPEVLNVQCEYPLIQWSQRVPYHMVHGFSDFLNQKLGLEIHATEFKGDLHLSPLERSGGSLLRQRFGVEIPYWLIAAGGKTDVTIKWWEPARYQQVVDLFIGRIQFVQVGAVGDFHPKLRGVIDLRGKTTLRDLVRLVHHAQGVLCGVTGLMHLAAAVEVPEGPVRLRPCVVIAGGREPVHWEAYPGHQFIHSIGALSCCAHGGCWRSRAVPLGDGDKRDESANLCTNLSGALPRCMDLISADEVARRIELHFADGAREYLAPSQARAAARLVKASQGAAFDHLPLNPSLTRPRLEWAIRQLPPYPGGFKGRGIVICAGGVRFFANAWVCLNLLRWLGCRLPVQIWHLGPAEIDQRMRALVAPLGAECVDALAVSATHPMRSLRGCELKPFALTHCRFREVLMLEADNVPAVDPGFLFRTPQFRDTGAVFWPDHPHRKAAPQVWRLCGLEPRDEPPFETGQVLLDKRRSWTPLQLCLWMNGHSDFFHQHTLGDKETFHLAWRKLAAPYAMPARNPEGRMRHFDFAGRLLFQHRNTDQWNPFAANRRIPGFRHERQCLKFLNQLRERWDFRIEEQPASHGPTTPPLPAVTPTAPSPSAPSVTPAARRPAEAKPGPLTLVTLYDHHMAGVGRITSALLHEYAARQGYACVVHTKLLDPDRPASWSKVLAVRQALLAAPGGWVMWIDADAVIVNHRIRAQDLMPKGFEAAFASDFNGLCSGIFLLHSSDWTLRLLDTLFFLGDLNHDPDGYGPKWEQNTLKYILTNFAGIADRVAILPQNRLNSSLDTYQPGDFILHLGGMPNGERLRRLRELDRWLVK